VWTIGTVSPGSLKTLAITVTAAAPPADNSDQHGERHHPINSTRTEQFGVVHRDGTGPPADLALSKSVNNATPNVGDRIHGDLQNLGLNSATGVTVTDLLPLDDVLSATPSRGPGSGTGVWTVGTVTTATPQTLRFKPRCSALQRTRDDQRFRCDRYERRTTTRARRRRSRPIWR
jgi:uncharacterized repeat protein (TIGR01451 family)